MLSEAQFPFLAEKGHVVSLVGGGGKTTLLYAFARHCAAKGWRVLVSTTTHIRQPGENYAADEAALASLWAAGRYAVAGVPAEQGKLTALPPEQLTCWMAQADMVLLEADGAKRMPCKVPAAHEPVLLRKAISCWPWQDYLRWADLCGRSASGWSRPAPCWALPPKRF